MHARRSAAVLVFAAVAVATTCDIAVSRDDDATARATPAQKKAASALEHDVVELLAAIDPASDLAALQRELAPKLAAAVEKQFKKLKPGDAPTAIESTDGRFVVVVIGDSPDGANGRDVRATSDAELLLVVGGHAGARSAGGECYGGTGHAEATKGIGIGLGGSGGRGKGEGVGSGGGGAAGATGKVGSIALGGAGGKPAPNGGRGSDGTGVDPVNLKAVIKAAKDWDGK